MSHKFKRPWSHAKMGTDHAKLIKTARNIKDEAELQRIIRESDPEIALRWLEIVRPHLRFELTGSTMDNQ